jgi:energy-converting hydrogenase A subunit R
VRVFISDCEGPLSKNDNAFETTAHFVPNGGKLFAVISKYDDVLADVLKRPGHRAGATLKLVLPFLKAYGVTDRKMEEFSARDLLLIPDVENTLQYVRSITQAFIVSTSYEHYIKALCQAVGFPFENAYCTRLSIDKYRTTEKEKTKLKCIAEEIARMQILEIPPNAESLEDLPEADQKVIRRLDEIFCKEIAEMESGKFYSEINPVGGSEKAEAIRDIVNKVRARLSDVMYVGDSITDEEAFKLVKKNDGLAVSFNGNQYAVDNAEIGVLSENSTVTAVIADVFVRLGKQETLNLVENWNRRALDKSQVSQTLLAHLFKLYPRELPKVRIITSENMDVLAKESSEFRKKVRGKTIGRLG